MFKPLHLESDLTPIQRAYVLGIEPFKITPKQFVVSTAIQAIYIFAAVSVLATAFDPDHVSRAGFNIAKFLAWVVVLFSMLLAVVNIGTFLYLAYVASEAQACCTTTDTSASAQKKHDTFRKTLDSRVQAYRHGSYQVVSKWISRVSMLCIFAGLVMNGYVFLPIVMAFAWGSAWFAGLFDRVAVIKSIQQLFPDEGNRAVILDGVIDITPPTPRDTGLDLSSYPHA
jgi:hypothetical protein